MELLVMLALYLIPTAVAFGRQTANRGAVAVVNILLGWTVIGWIVALAMACGARKVQHVP